MLLPKGGIGDKTIEIDGGGDSFGESLNSKDALRLEASSMTKTTIKEWLIDHIEGLKESLGHPGVDHLALGRPTYPTDSTGLDHLRLD